MATQIIDKPCATCGEDERAISATGNQYKYCRGCMRTRNQASHRKHRPQRLEAQAKRRRANGQSIREYGQRWQQRRRDEGYYRTPEKRAKRQAYYLRIKVEVFNHYGGVFCQCCGVDDLLFLTLDHIAGDGASHRAMLGKMSSQNMYLWIRANKYPPGFQVLCFNCNQGKHQSKINICPHQTERLRLAA